MSAHGGTLARVSSGGTGEYDCCRAVCAGDGSSPSAATMVQAVRPIGPDLPVEIELAARLGEEG